MTKIRMPNGPTGQRTFGLNTDHIISYVTFEELEQGSYKDDAEPKYTGRIGISMELIAGPPMELVGDQATAIIAVLRSEFRPIELVKKTE